MDPITERGVANAFRAKNVEKISHKKACFFCAQKWSLNEKRSTKEEEEKMKLHNITESITQLGHM